MGRSPTEPLRQRWTEPVPSTDSGTGLKVAHVVRQYGGVTEPFIEQRVKASRPLGELWYERLSGPPPMSARQVTVPLIQAGSLGDRIFHRLPIIAVAARSSYRTAERQSRPSVVHAHYLTTGYVVAQAIRTPLVVSAYGFDVGVIPSRPYWRSALNGVMKKARALFVEGPHMRQTAIALGFDERKVLIIPIAAGLQDLVFTAPSERHAGGELAPFHLVSCGRLVEKKGHDLAIEAFAGLLNFMPAGSTLEIIGAGPLYHQLALKAARLSSPSTIVFSGALPRSEYLRRLGHADLLIAASRTGRNGDTEGGAPTTILDAQALGVPIVASDHADIPFLVKDSETGYLATEGSAASLQEAVLRALAGSQAWNTIASRARHQIEVRHCDAAVSAALTQAYELAAS